MTAPDPANPPETPPRRKGRRCGWTGKDRFDFGATRLRVALTKLARDPDPDARTAGAALSDEAAEMLHALATRADNTTTSARRAQAKADRLVRKVDRLLQEQGQPQPSHPRKGPR
ncbi:hypothetical protein [Actinomadura rubrisoli]|uniref:Uncharacterized protein n=1 Tax=Actinomadura rubrisoli TaxID=2530368 RepID=A0A4R5A056_9ACTN|nr:hypothetical protein [Actinomadura rubrisoli]TDD65103.1 hypothetical protein E1298_41680 [Actinomadura rubrisoli]